MRWLKRLLWRWLWAEDGPTAVEYAVMLALILIVCFVAIQVLGTTTNSAFNEPKLEGALSGTSST
jgi:pilus assembly protein Flp/PilA